MKKIILSVMAGIVLFTSCDLLNSDPYTEFTKSNYFTSEKNVELYANYFYNEFSGYGNNGSYGQYYFSTLGDNQCPTGLTAWSYTQVPGSNSTWSNCYTEIRRANIMIAETPKIDMSEDKINNWVGIARLYRAWQHYILVRAFGDCYWVETELKPSDEAILYGPRQDRDTVMDKILEDLNFAVENINQNASSKTAYNKWVALAIKSQICLYEGTFCKYRTQAENGKAADEARAKKYLEEAVKASNAIMDNTEFALTTGAAGYRANYNSLDLSGNKEMIMYKKYTLGVLAHGTQDYCCGSTQTMGLSKAAFNAYLFIDGAPKAFTAKETSDHGEVISVIYPNGDTCTEVSIGKALRVRDPRMSEQMDSTLRYPGHGVIRYHGEKCADGAAENTSSTGYGVLKFDNNDPAQLAKNRQATNGNETDAPLFWLAVVILDNAEANAELGNDALAKASINMLRNRVGMPTIETTLGFGNDPANNMGVSNLIWEVRRERRIELMYDLNDRYWSMVRWHQLDKLDTSKYPEQAKGAWFDVVNFPGVADLVAAGRFDAEGYIDMHNGQSDRVYESDGYKHYLYPIASGEITLNPQIGQNPGW